MARSDYRLRMLACLAGSLVLLIGLFHFWPGPSTDPPLISYDDRAHDVIEVNEIVPSRQQQPPPPPPAPLPPVEVPYEVELEDIDLDFTAELDSDAWADDPGPPAIGDDEGQQSSGPDVAARQLRLVEPTYTRAAQRENIRAQVVVEVLVAPSGDVLEATISERLLLDDENRPHTSVSHLGYGLEESALEAAQRTTFVPAQANGEPVESRTTITIRFGV